MLQLILAQYPHEHDLPAVLAMPPPAPPHQLLLRWFKRKFPSFLLSKKYSCIFRHASQSSLDESSQKLVPRAAEPRRPPYRNPSHPTKVQFLLLFYFSREGLSHFQGCGRDAGNETSRSAMWCHPCGWEPGGASQNNFWEKPLFPDPPKNHSCDFFMYFLL